MSTPPDRYTVESNPVLRRRYDRTLAFLQRAAPPPARVLDVGVDNPFSAEMRRTGYDVRNTPLVDLDEQPEVAAGADADVVTAFEILEHLVNPLGVLRAVEAPRLVVTVPLSLWFAPAYRNPSDPWDRHFHEFEDWQFDWLLDKAGWTVVHAEKWKSPIGRLGLRPLLRAVTPRYYAVEAERR